MPPKPFYSNLSPKPLTLYREVMACVHLAVNPSPAIARNSVLLGFNKRARFSVPSPLCFENFSNNLKEVGIWVCIVVSVKDHYLSRFLAFISFIINSHINHSSTMDYISFLSLSSPLQDNASFSLVLGTAFWMWGEERILQMWGQYHPQLGAADVLPIKRT